VPESGLAQRAKARIFHALQRTARKRGFDLLPLDVPPATIGMLLDDLAIDLVLDGGAAGGRFGRELRQSGYRGGIVSFEPLSGPFGQLAEAAGADPAWDALNVALGDAPGTATINVAGNFESSSLLEMEDRHRDMAPESTYIGSEAIQVATVDSIWSEVAGTAEHVLLKLDLQGYELKALQGAKTSLPKIRAIHAELSLVPLYSGGPVWNEVVDFLRGEGFHPAGIEPEFQHRETGELMQVNATFLRA
jgi:FkbM family methyltransferase